MANDKNFRIKNGLDIGGSFIGKTGTVTGNATLDLSTGNTFEVTPTADVTFTFSNPPSDGAYEFGVNVTGVLIDNAYDLANASYDSVSFSVATEESTPSHLAFNNDGTKLYVVGRNGDSVYQYTLSTAFDLSTASYDSVSFSVVSQETSPAGLEFNSDGTKMYVTGNGSTSVHQYTLSTAFDLSTASYDSVSFSFASQEGSPQDIAFNSDGTKMYMVGYGTDFVFQYSLSIAYDVSTASYDSVSFSIGGQEAFAYSLTFSNDGTKMYIVGEGSNTVYQYDLSTAFDLSTASYNSVSFSVASQATAATGIVFNNDGTKMYYLAFGVDTIFQYSTGSIDDATFTYPASVKWAGGTAPTAPADGETDVLNFVTADGGTTYYGFQSGDNFS
jgi:DNA-binding beta-propeller fold protein YncE